MDKVKNLHQNMMNSLMNIRVSLESHLVIVKKLTRSVKKRVSPNSQLLESIHHIQYLLSIMMVPLKLMEFSN